MHRTKQLHLNNKFVIVFIDILIFYNISFNWCFIFYYLHDVVTPLRFRCRLGTKLATDWLIDYWSSFGWWPIVLLNILLDTA